MSLLSKDHMSRLVKKPERIVSVVIVNHLWPFPSLAFALSRFHTHS
jgi:hypothetical protein